MEVNTACIHAKGYHLNIRNGFLEEIRAGFAVVPRSVDLGCTRFEKAGGGGHSTVHEGAPGLAPLPH